MLIALSLLVLVAVGARHHDPTEATLLIGLLALALATGRWLLRDFRSHPAGFPSRPPRTGCVWRPRTPSERRASPNRGDG